MNGLIFELTRFAVHDGPGIRSTLFLKGCPLRCPWCQNPEGLQKAVRLWQNPSLCIGCRSCVHACKAGALSFSDRLHIDEQACNLCGDCIAACPAAALSFDGREVSSEEAVELLLRDREFYDPGGVTLSGGEVFAQWQFALEVLAACHDRGVDTAIESCLYVEPEILKKFLPVVDHFIADIKYFDRETHRQVLGVDNAVILKNYAALVDAGADVLVRTPLIPGYTATEENIRSIARFVAKTDRKARYELLNFNPLCRGKYDSLEQPYPVAGRALTAEEMNFYYDILRREGIFDVVEE